jgi:hypothetical protein
MARGIQVQFACLGQGEGRSGARRGRLQLSIENAQGDPITGEGRSGEETTSTAKRERISECKFDNQDLRSHHYWHYR